MRLSRVKRKSDDCSTAGMSDPEGKLPRTLMADWVILFFSMEPMVLGSKRKGRGSPLLSPSCLPLAE